MFTSTATWRCKCGARIKIETEVHTPALRATVSARCPRCGDEQLVYGRKIVSVIEESDSVEERQLGRLTRFYL